MNETSWSLGTLVAFPLALLFFALFAVGGIVLIARAKEAGYDETLYKGFGYGFILFSFVIAGFTAYGMYPYKAEYHQWKTMGGEVTKIDSRLLDGANQKFVVTFANGDQLGCNDTRCAAVEVGDTLLLSCKRTWQYAGTDGYDCNFVEVERDGS